MDFNRKEQVTIKFNFTHIVPAEMKSGNLKKDKKMKL